ncbi:MAG: FtsW/RodA/SpoVE family cell cycle protein [Lachnospiraceae bacterium]|nr:FtsW/RodA/SpoVE family cell cycle protein [Lachnospiraceae bacterium]
MTTWITATANFILLFFLALYVGAAYAALWTRQWESGLNRCMGVCRYLLHGYGFFVLVTALEDYRLIPFYLFQLAFFILADILQKRFFSNGMPMLYQNMQLLLGTGFLILARLSFDNAVKQFIMAVIAYGICLLIPWVIKKIPNLEKLGLLYTLLGLGLLAVVLVLGSEIFGAKNWLTIKGVTFQPSEFVKLTFVLSIAALLVRKTESRYKNLLLVSVVAALHVGLLALSNDFGGALIFFAVYLLMLFVVSADLLFPAAAVLAGSFAALLAYQYSGHIQERVQAWQNPFSCIENEGYQIAQSLFAIGSGKWFGSGLTEGMPKTVPVVKSDFIFSAVSEELGAIFAALLLCIYINCMIWMLTLALERKQPFFFAVTTGAAALFGVQLFLNVGGVIKLIPSTGVTLALLSYGGSSLFSTMFLFQGIQGMRGMELPKKRKKKEEKKTGQQLRMVAVCAMLMLMLGITTAYFLGVTVKEASLSCNNDYNQRIRQMEETMPKGKILAADGTILAQSITGEDGNLYRVYPHGASTAFVTGQMQMGRTGLEEEYRMELYSVSLDFWEKVRKKAAGEPVEGNRLVTTIDMELQKAAYEALEGHAGAVGVLEVKTGKLLAMVSTPSYNPNEISVEWEALNQRKDAPFLNRLMNGLYPPGSTFKLVTTLAYLQEYTAADFTYTCTGTARFRNTTVRCFNEKAHGTQTLEEAFVNSCNTAYAFMGEQVSAEAFRTVAEELGFGTVWPGTLTYTADRFSLTEKSADAVWVQTTFGQGETLMTPFHKLMIASAIANGGSLQLPFLVEKVENCNGELVTWYGSAGTVTLMEPEEAEILKNYMTAESKDRMKELADLGVKAAGKTGTAQHAGSDADHAWYLCFAPADDPQIAVVVLVENSGTGNQYAVPVAEKVLKEYFK